MSDILTRDQKLAQKSYDIVHASIERQIGNKEYKSFAKSFSCLIHTCGLMQATAFALKDEKKKIVLEDFVKILSEIDNPDLKNCEKFIDDTRNNLDVIQYMNRTRLAILAAGWLKRQADALIPDEK